MAVVIVFIYSVRQVITNDQTLAAWSLIYIFDTFLNMLAFPNNAVFCITPTLYLIPSFSIHLSRFFVTLPGEPVTTCTTSTILSFHNLAISLFKSWYFSTFSIYFSPALTSAGTAVSIIFSFPSFLWITIMSVFLASIAFSLCHTKHWYSTIPPLFHFHVF